MTAGMAVLASGDPTGPVWLRGVLIALCLAAIVVGVLGLLRMRRERQQRR